MRKLLLSLLLLFLASSSFAGGGATMMMVMGSPPAGATTWIYSGDGVYGNGVSKNSGIVVGGTVTTATGITIGKISVYINAIGTATECKVGIYNPAGNLIDTVVVSSPAVGWNDANLGTTVATTDGQSVVVVAMCNGTWTAEYDDSTNGYWGSETYSAGFSPNTSYLNADTGKAWGVRCAQ